MSKPKLWLTSMSNGDEAALENAMEMIKPIEEYLDGVIWVVHNPLECKSIDTYLNGVIKQGRVIHMDWPSGRHWVSMNMTLYTGLMDEGDYVIWSDALERPTEPFVSQVKTQIGPSMTAQDIDVLAYYGKPFLMRYRETLEYKGSPHWHLEGWNGRGVEWANTEPDETKVRLNVRPQKRTDPLHWVVHYARYWLFPAGCNHALLGLEKQGDPSVLFPIREGRRLEFRREMKRRGYPLTIEGLKTMLEGPLDDTLKSHLNAEKTLSDVYHLWHGNGHLLKDTHLPSDAIPIL